MKSIDSIINDILLAIRQLPLSKERRKQSLFSMYVLDQKKSGITYIHNYDNFVSEFTCNDICRLRLQYLQSQ